MKMKLMAAVFALTAAPALADNPNVTVTSSDVTDAASEHFINYYGGTLKRSCDLMSGNFNPGGTAIKGTLSISKADLRRLSHILPDDVQAKSYEEQTAWLDALTPEAHAPITEKFIAFQKQGGFYDAVQKAFNSTFPGIAEDYDSEHPQAIAARLKTLADDVQRETGFSVSIAVTVTDSCGKPPAPQN